MVLNIFTIQQLSYIKSLLNFTPKSLDKFRIVPDSFRQNTREFSAESLQFCSFISQVASTRRQRSSSSQAATCYYQSNHSKIEAISLIALPNDKTSELTNLSLHYLFLMLNVKPGSCEYQLFKSFGLTRPGNRTQVCQVRGGRSNHS